MAEGFTDLNMEEALNIGAAGKRKQEDVRLRFRPSKAWGASPMGQARMARSSTVSKPAPAALVAPVEAAADVSEGAPLAIDVVDAAPGNVAQASPAAAAGVQASRRSGNREGFADMRRECDEYNHGAVQIRKEKARGDKSKLQALEREKAKTLLLQAAADRLRLAEAKRQRKAECSRVLSEQRAKTERLTGDVFHFKERTLGKPSCSAPWSASRFEKERPPVNEIRKCQVAYHVTLDTQVQDLRGRPEPLDAPGPLGGITGTSWDSSYHQWGLPPTDRRLDTILVWNQEAVEAKKTQDREVREAEKQDFQIWVAKEEQRHEAQEQVQKWVKSQKMTMLTHAWDEAVETRRTGQKADIAAAIASAREANEPQVPPERRLRKPRHQDVASVATSPAAQVRTQSRGTTPDILRSLAGLGLGPLARHKGPLTAR